MSGPMGALGVGATLIGGIFKTIGDYQALSAKGAMYGAEADAYGKLSAAEREAANVTEYAGGRAEANVGRQYAAMGGKQAVEYGAGGVGGPVTQQVRQSIGALGRQAEAETFGKYGETAYQQRVTGAEEAYKAGLYKTAQAGVGTERFYTLVGDITSTVGGTAGVAQKWYDVGGGTGGGGTPDYPLQGPTTPSFLEEG